MIENKAPRTGVHPAQGKCLTCSVQDNFIMSLDECQETKIRDLLHYGAANPISCRELCTLLPGWRPREVTRAIEAERRNGVPICANGGGYYLPATDAEVDTYLLSLGHRLREVQRTRDAIAATRQSRMDLGGGGAS